MNKYMPSVRKRRRTLLIVEGEKEKISFLKRYFMKSILRVLRVAGKYNMFVGRCIKGVRNGQKPRKSRPAQGM